VAKKHCVLVIEDDELGFQLVKQILRKMPLDFTHASTGAAAIKFLAKTMPALIIMDITLPDMRGWDVLDKFKTDERLKSVHVIVLTGHDSPVHRLIGGLKDIAVYLNKPVHAEELRQKVRELLNLDA
jgi:CheY-like chemotaxis protein